MTVLNNCDSLSAFRIRGGVSELTIDSSDFKEGTGSLLIKGDAEGRYAEVYCDISTILSNWTTVQELKLWLEALDSRYNFEVGIYAPDRGNRWGLWTSIEALNVWGQKTLMFPSDFGVVGTPDITNVTTLLLAFSNEGAQRRWKVDLIETLEAEILTHLLTIQSSPISGVPITVNGASAGNSPITLDVTEGEHSIQVPLEVTI